MALIEKHPVKWEYERLFGSKHRFITVVGDIRIIVEHVEGHLADWIAYDVESWDIIHRSFYDDETHYRHVGGAIRGAERWLRSSSYMREG